MALIGDFLFTDSRALGQGVRRVKNDGIAFDETHDDFGFEVVALTQLYVAHRCAAVFNGEHGPTFAMTKEAAYGTFRAFRTWDTITRTSTR